MAARPLRPPRLLPAESDREPVSALVRRERASVEAEGGRLLVVVGAEWCEPCRRFHAAVAEGRLDAVFPGLVFLELDLDRDGARLREDGYGSRLIPLFALPGPDGRASADPTQRFEGSIKGEGAVDEITPRLRRLLGGG